jgi:hypothetical protein
MTWYVNVVLRDFLNERAGHGEGWKTRMASQAVGLLSSISA